MGPDWPRVLDAADAFHAFVAGEPRPSFIEARTHQWAIADRVAWGDLAPLEFADDPRVRRLLALTRPVDAESQVIHGDLAGNVLFAPDQPPAVVDVTAYWRPVAYARAIVIVDAIAWDGAPFELLDVSTDVRYRQLLVRALLFGIIASPDQRHEPLDRLVDAIAERIAQDEGRLSR
jgi:hypothetical protein